MMTHQQEEKLKELARVFLQENTKINLSAFRDEESVWVGNILDSLAALEAPRASACFPDGGAILEVGTGGGFPLLPLAICKPDCRFFGLDATRKKLDAVGRMTDALTMKNTKLINGRAEELGQDQKCRQKFDAVLARALAPLNVLLELCIPFAKVGGHVIAWKSMNIESEINASLKAKEVLRCRLAGQYTYTLPEPYGRRQLLFFEKTGSTPAGYPRSTGTPKKKPII